MPGFTDDVLEYFVNCVWISGKWANSKDTDFRTIRIYMSVKNMS